MKKIKFNFSINESAKGNRKSTNTLFVNDYAVSFFYKFPAKIFGFFLVTLVSFNFACESPSLKANRSKPASAEAQKNNLSSFENDLQSMRNADFDFIYVFRRKDGGTLDAEDKKYLKAYSPAATNRFILTDENKAAIAGSSYKFEAENIDNLQKRFAIENFSKPENQELPANQNFNK